MYRIPMILVVDNDADFVGLASRALEASAYRVIVASDRKGGLASAKANSPDLIIVGAVGPRGDSFKLHKELREDPQTGSIPLLLVDVRPEEHSRKGWKIYEGMQMEAEDYLSRPIEPAELVDAVGRILKRTSQKQMGLDEVSERLEAVLERVQKIETLLTR